MKKQMKIIISPFSQKLRGKDYPNPKNYPFWEEVIANLKNLNTNYIIQIGVKGEDKLKGADEFLTNLSFDEIKKLIQESDCWISVDNFLPHFCNTIGINGIVLWGRSDPRIYGYNKNINLLKDRKNLRPDQMGLWESLEYDKDVFVSADVVTHSVLNFKRKT